MNKKFTYPALAAFFTIAFSSVALADDIDDMLFAPPPKITAGSSAPRAITNTQPMLIPSEIDADEFDFDNIEPALPDDNPLPPPTARATPPIQRDDGSLTDAIRGGVDADGESPRGFFEGTWVEKLTTTGFGAGEGSVDAKAPPSPPGSGSSGTLESMVQNSKTQNQRSNASVFDISGVMLRMTRPQAEAAMLKRGFKMVSQKFEIPNFIRWRYEEQCRNAGVVGYERLASCVVTAAKEHNHQFVQSEKFIKYDTKEEITITYTSNFTNNKVYRVVYRSNINQKYRGGSQKNQYLRDIQIYDFWRRINQKYGVPDNKEDVIWGMGGNKPFMRASTGSLFLEDPMLRELDYTRMSREDQRFINTSTYNF